MDSSFSGPIYFINKASAKNIFFNRSHLKSLSLTNAVVKNKISMGEVQISGSIYANKLSAEELSLWSGFVDGFILMDYSTIKGSVDMTNAVVHKRINMEGALLGDVYLRDATIGSQFYLDKATISGQLNMAGASVGEFFWLRGATVKGTAYFIYLNVADDLVLDDSNLSSVDLTGANIQHTLRLGSAAGKAPKWDRNAKLTLLNTTAREIQDEEECTSDFQCKSSGWPSRLDLRGFSYTALVGATATEANDMSLRPAKWWLDWLHKDDDFSPETYFQLAERLTASGRKETANSILYHEKIDEIWDHFLKGRYFSALLGFFQWAVVGYGGGYYLIMHVAIFVIVFVTLGILVLRRARAKTKYNLPKYPIAFCFDLLIPLVRLDENNYKIELKGFEKNYFYFHKIMGYVLAVFLAAGVANFVQSH
jgi:hypothetical protein